MADIYCPRCGEPWDMECFHDEVAYRYREVFPKPWYVSENPGDTYTRYDEKNEGWYSQSEYEKIYKPIKDDFFRKGCVILTAYTDGELCEINPNTRMARGIQQVAVDIMGDDIDGIVSMLEDAEDLGLF